MPKAEWALFRGGATTRAVIRAGGTTQRFPVGALETPGDIRRALGDRGEHDPHHIATVGDLYAKTGGPIAGKKRSARLRFRATDGDWTLGEGPEVAGPGIDLILAMTGRVGALESCEGAGVETLRARA